MPAPILADPLSECWGLIRGDYRSPNGAMRHEECRYPPRFKVTDLDPTGTSSPLVPATVAYCGVHVRMFRRLPNFYRVEAI